ncbi:L-proline trans-4-hydroxylase-like isoform X2 [Amphiura filiformis]|uniref:L-proline trans-4-hydroxylase-like isoform X2 n=1 Tax=Amphiura filiformis TaxID=82378 RepID=UPI003B21A360
MANRDFQYHDDFTVTDEMKAAWNDDGYILVRSILSPKEISILGPALESDDGVRQHAFGLDDGEGSLSKMCLWNHPGNDITGMLFRSRKMVDTAEQLLGGEVYHYHTKLMMKEAHTGGKHIWHQDYGYWYQNGCLFPDMMSVFVAIDKCDIGNGCLQVLKGSHKLGRIEHGAVGGQTGANLERVNQAAKELPLVHVEMQPGDALFFHCNVLHKSEQNKSDRRRWVFIAAYNRATNNPVKDHHHPKYTPLVKVPNKAILTCGNKTDMTGKDFMDPKKDLTVHQAKRLKTK